MTDIRKNSQSIRQILMQKDEVTLVDSDGNLLGREEKFKAHKHPAKLHLASSVWLFNSLESDQVLETKGIKRQVLLQKRSQKKIVGAGWWANTICGNVWPTETYFDCAIRRLREELGIVGVEIKPLYKFEYQAYCNEVYGEHELDQVYIGEFNGKVLPNKEEVSEVSWVDFDELVAKVATINYISAEQTLLQKETELKSMTKPVSIIIDDNDFLIAPWSILMLRDARLIETLS